MRLVERSALHAGHWESQILCPAYARRNPLQDELAHCFPAHRRPKNSPAIMPGGYVSATNVVDFSHERQRIGRTRTHTWANFPKILPFSSLRWRDVKLELIISKKRTSARYLLENRSAILIRFGNTISRLINTDYIR